MVWFSRTQYQDMVTPKLKCGDGRMQIWTKRDITEFAAVHQLATSSERKHE